MDSDGLYRQGDVALAPVERPPHLRKAGLKLAKRTRLSKEGPSVIMLAAGEETGHHHVIKDASARPYVDTQSRQRFVAVGAAGASVTHEEHEPLALPQGFYEIVRQVEYEPPAEQSQTATPSFSYVRD